MGPTAEEEVDQQDQLAQVARLVVQLVAQLVQVAQVVEEEEARESITSTSPRHKSTTHLLIHTPIKPTLSPQLRLLLPLWQPLQLWPPQVVLLEVSASVVLPSAMLA